MSRSNVAAGNRKEMSVSGACVPDIVVLADGWNGQFDALTKHTSQSMLPVAGKPILEHVLDSLTSVAHHKVHVVASRFIDDIERFVGNGDRWGLDIDIWVSSGNSSALQVVSRHAPSIDSRWLVVDCRYLRDFDLNPAIKILQSSVEGVVVATRDRHPIGLYWHSIGRTSNSKVQLPRFQEVSAGVCHDVASLQGYFETNLKIAGCNRPTTITLRGREQASGLVAGAGTSISAHCIKTGRVMAGRESVANKTVEFRGTVVLGSNVVIDRASTISNSVILDNSYIGKNLTIENAIIAGDTFISMETGSHIQLVDQFILSELRPGLMTQYLINALNRSLGFFALLLSFPLWLIALWVARSESPGQSIVRRTALGNAFVAGRLIHKPFNDYSFSCRNKLLRHLPLLLQIARGKIRWFGVSIVNAESLSGRTDSWERVRDHLPVGLLGPAQVEYGIAMDDEHGSCQQDAIAARLMADAYYPESGFLSLVKQSIFNYFPGRSTLSNFRKLRINSEMFKA